MKSSIRDVSEIIEISESRYTPDKMAYQHIIKQVDKLIRSRAQDQQHEAAFEVPAMILFKPHYNRDQLTRKVYRHYKKIGFHASVDNYTMNLSWRAKDIHEEEDKYEYQGEEDEEVEAEEESSDSADDESSDEDVPDKKIVVKTAPASLAKRVSKMS